MSTNTERAPSGVYLEQGREVSSAASMAAPTGCSPPPTSSNRSGIPTSPRATRSRGAASIRSSPAAAPEGSPALPGGSTSRTSSATAASSTAVTSRCEPPAHSVRKYCSISNGVTRGRAAAGPACAEGPVDDVSAERFGDQLGMLPVAPRRARWLARGRSPASCWSVEEVGHPAGRQLVGLLDAFRPSARDRQRQGRVARRGRRGRSPCWRSTAAEARRTGLLGQPSPVHVVEAEAPLDAEVAVGDDVVDRAR